MFSVLSQYFAQLYVHRLGLSQVLRAQELSESRGGRPGLSVPNSPFGLFGHKATLNSDSSELGSCVKVGVAILGSPSLTVISVSVDIKEH